MIFSILKSLRTLLSYLVLGTFFGGLCLPLLPFIFENNMPFRIWYLIDVLICTVAHNTYMRTISGWTGQHMSSKKRYCYQAKVIDWLAQLVGDTSNHCFRQYRWEIKKGYVK